MPNLLDLVLVLAFAVALPLWSHFVMWPRHVRAVDAGDRRARTRMYVRTLIEEWLLTAASLALVTRSLLPGMALHAVIDLGSGWITYAAMRGGDEPGAAGRAA